MLDFLIGNMPTIIVGTVVALVILIVSFKMIKDKKNGKSSCGCNCAGCPSAGMCHKK